MTLILMLFLIVVDPLDRQISAWLRLHSLPEFAVLMDRSLLEGEALGAGDFALFLHALIGAAWLSSFLPQAPERLRTWRAPLGYIVITSILTVIWVHLFKGVVARPRPYELEMVTSSWQGWSERWLRGWGHGSFPSGHTAQAMSLMTLSYALYAMRYRRLALMIAALVTIFVFCMALSRIMIGAHWPTDTVAAISISWLLAHTRFRSWQKHREQRD
jgi:membrane-associated phospholipid phosphatase